MRRGGSAGIGELAPRGSIRVRVTARCQARFVGAWPAGELLGLDFETTGIDRFNDVPVSYALVSVVEGVVVRSWSGLIDPGREIPPEATAVHGISTERARDEGMPLREAVSLVSDAVVAASARGVPLAGMKLDYDLTILEMQARDLCGWGPVERGWCGPVLDAVVIDRHFDPDRKGRRTLVDLCAHYGIEIGNADDASADATASIEVLFALALRYDASVVVRSRPAPPRSDRLAPGVDGKLRLVASRRGDDPQRPARSTSGRSPPRCCRRPEPDQIFSRSQTMSTPSFSARTTWAGFFLSMWPTRPL